MKKQVWIAAVALFVGSAALMGQTKEEAANSFNQGAAMASENPAGAITALEKAVQLATAVGAEADDVKKQAVEVLPNLYLQVANNLLKNKDYPAAIKAFDATVKAGEKYDNSEVVTKSNDAVAQIFFAQAIAAMKEKNYDETVVLFDKVLAIDKENTDAALYKAEAFRAAGKFDESTAVSEALIKSATEKGDSVLAGKVKKSACAAYLAKGFGLYKEKKAAEAISSLEKSLEYGETTDAYNALVQICNAAKQYDKTIEAATKALVLMKSATPQNKAGMNYQLAVAWQAKGNVAKACEAYKNAMYGQYAEQAKYQCETVLKCN